jgi:hypothetical protein
LHRKVCNIGDSALFKEHQLAAFTCGSLIRTINRALYVLTHGFWCNIKASRSQAALPLPVRRALRKLGADISTARRRRNLTIALVAERAFVGRNTITRVERGDPGVSLGIYATVLFVLGLAERLMDLADPAADAVGLSLEAERLQQRARTPKTAR